MQLRIFADPILMGVSEKEGNGGYVEEVPYIIAIRWFFVLLVFNDYDISVYNVL